MAAAQFDWSKYLELAEELGKRVDEASRRSAISRAYYYVYHLALERAEANDFIAVIGGVHTQLWQLFTASPDPDCLKLGTIAVRLKKLRERADYEPMFVRIDEEIPFVLEDAQVFAALLSKLPARHPSKRAMRQ